MKAIYETPQFSMTECRIEDAFLVSAVKPEYDDLENWSPVMPPKK